jgi:hypothetical protein
MSFIFTFSSPDFTKAKYDSTIQKLKDAGAGAPKGRSIHIAFGDPENLHVTDVWESMEDFQAFGQTLMPILKELDVDPGQPDVQPVHNVILG